MTEPRLLGYPSAADRSRLRPAAECNEQRLYKLDAHQETLCEQRDGGNISEGTYRAQVVVVVAETEVVNRTTNQGAAFVADLPDDLREERGIDTEAIQILQERVWELTSLDVAEIARGITGDRVGGPVNPHDQPDYDRSGGNSDRASGQSDDEGFDDTNEDQ